MRFRALNSLYAALFGYFWLPCPICGQGFGGHEWKNRDGNRASIPAPDGKSGRVGICPDCTRAGRGGDENVIIWTKDRRVDL
jgi:hypothetical protein